MKISVAMATYNGERYLREQLDSIRAQSRPIDELVITDDCSTDGTLALLQSYKTEHPDFPMRVFPNEKNLGYKMNFHAACGRCDGDLIFFCDQDDAWMPEKVEEMCAILDEHPEILVLASSFTLMDGEGRELYRKPRSGWSNQNLYHRSVEQDALVRVPLSDLYLHNLCQGCAQAIRREVADRFLELYTGLIPHDWFINLIAAAGEGLYLYHHVLFRYRIHEGNALGLAPKITLKERLDPCLRTLEARQSRDVLSSLSVIDPSLMSEPQTDEGRAMYAREAKEQAEFVRAYLDAVRDKKTFRMIRMRYSERYQQIRSGVGWVEDVFCTVFQRRPSAAELAKPL